MSTNIQLDAQELLNKIGKFENYGKILVPAMSKTKRKMKTVLSSEIRTLYAVKKGDVDPAISVNFQTAPPNITATIKSRRFTLGRFMVGSFKRGRTVKVRVKKGQTKSLGSSIFATAIGGRMQIAKRKGDARLPIEVMRTVAVPQMAMDAGVSEKTLEKTVEGLYTEIESQHKRFCAEA